MHQVIQGFEGGFMASGFTTGTRVIWRQALLKTGFIDNRLWFLPVI
jgi:hypothetical protein